MTKFDDDQGRMQEISEWWESGDINLTPLELIKKARADIEFFSSQVTYFITAGRLIIDLDIDPDVVGEKNYNLILDIFGAESEAVDADDDATDTAPGPVGPLTMMHQSQQARREGE